MRGPSLNRRRRPAAAETLERRTLLSASLVRDLNLDTASSAPFSVTDVNGTAFFYANDGVHGYELWKSDGTPGGTALIKDINPGAGHSAGPPSFGAGSPPPAMAVVGGVLYFSATDPAAGMELWRSDGTEAGTYRVKDIRPGTAWSSPANLTGVDGTLYFSANDGASGAELWKSDGTPEGTTLVADVNPGAAASSPHAFVGFGGKVFFGATSAATGSEVWTTDGTAAGTSLFKDLVPGTTSSYFTSAAVAGGRLFLLAGLSLSGKLYRSDGTPEGTALVPGVADNVFLMREAGGTLYFTHGPAGPLDAVTLSKVGPGEASATDIRPFNALFSMTALGSVLLFAGAGDVAGLEVWRSNGTAAGTVRLTDVRPESLNLTYRPLVTAGNRAYFFTNGSSTDLDLWSTDGTAAGTALVAEGAYFPSVRIAEGPAAVGGRLFYSLYDPHIGVEPWVSDGTAAGTHLVRDVNVTTVSSSFSPFVELHGNKIFAVDAGGADGGAHRRELWRTDGTPAGTVMIKPLLGDRSFVGSPFQPVRLGDNVYFADGINNLELWRTDGTPEGTTKVRSFAGAPAPFTPGNFPITGLTAAGRSLYFQASDGATGGELWKSDGTPEGTVMVTDMAPATGTIVLRGLVEYRGEVYFSAYTEATSSELWKTDGTPGGTTLVKDINPGTGASSPTQLRVVGDTLYFIAASSANDTELWKTDGTADGTIQVRDFYEGPFGGTLSLFPLGKYLIVRALAKDEPSELWALDTPTGAIEPLGDLLPDVEFANPQRFINYRDALYFTASGPDQSARLWRTDGTRAGTVLVKEVPTVPGESGFDIALGMAGNSLYWTPAASGFGRELWRSDGTPEGTRLAQDIVPGPGASRPVPLASIGDALLFSADDRIHGRELWRFDPPPAAATVAGRRLFYNNSAFDGRDAAPGPADDGAVASDKAPLLPGAAASFANVSSYTRGINGVMIDVAGLPPEGAALGPDDLLIEVTPAAGASRTGPAPSSVSVRRGAGAEGADRVTLRWPDGAIRNAWVRVTVLANERTGLAAPDVFSFGSLVGESGVGGAGAPLAVNALDLAATRAAMFSSVPLTSRFDFNRDGKVNALDLATVRANYLQTLPLPAPPPAAAGGQPTATLLLHDESVPAT